MEIANKDKKRAFKEWLKHIIYCEYVGNEFSELLAGRLEELYSDIDTTIDSFKGVYSKLVYKEIMKLITNLIEEFEEDVATFAVEKIEDIADEESEWLEKFSNLFTLAYIVPKNIKSQMKFAPFGSSGNYESLGVNTGDRIKKTVESNLRSAYLTKTSASEIKERINSKKGRTLKYLNTDVMTFTTAMFRTVQSATLHNSVKYVVYLAHLDNRTCLVCGKNHLRQFKVEEAPVIPIHENCRCTLIDSNLFFEESPQTYAEWLGELDDDELYEILGKTRFHMYKAGIPITSFVNDGRLLTLEELRNLTTFATTN